MRRVVSLDSYAIFFTSARQVLAQPRTVNASGRGTQALVCFAVLRRALA